MTGTRTVRKIFLFSVPNKHRLGVDIIDMYLTAHNKEREFSPQLHRTRNFRSRNVLKNIMRVADNVVHSFLEADLTNHMRRRHEPASLPKTEEVWGVRHLSPCKYWVKYYNNGKKNSKSDRWSRKRCLWSGTGDLNAPVQVQSGIKIQWATKKIW